MSQSTPPLTPPTPEFDRSSVDSGAYFQQGRHWSRLMFESVIVERSYLLLCLTVVVLSFLISAASLSSLFPLNQPVRMVFTNDNSGFDYPKLIRISRGDESLQHSLARYIAEQYVRAHEAYQYDRTMIDQRYRFVYNQSAADVFHAYRAALDVNNPQSPLNVLEQSGLRNIYEPYSRIISETAGNGVVSMVAEVYYTEAITQKKPVFARKKATLQFTMHEITIHKPSKSVYQYNPATGQPEKLKNQILFRVNSYQTVPAGGDNS